MKSPSETAELELRTWPADVERAADVVVQVPTDQYRLETNDDGSLTLWLTVPTERVDESIAVTAALFDRVRVLKRTGVDDPTSAAIGPFPAVLSGTEITPAQLRVGRELYDAGFYEWPRATTEADLADRLDMSQPTVNKYRRVFLRKLQRELFEPESVGLYDGPGRRPGRGQVHTRARRSRSRDSGGASRE